MLKAFFNFIRKSVLNLVCFLAALVAIGWLFMEQPERLVQIQDASLATIKQGTALLPPPWGPRTEVALRTGLHYDQTILIVGLSLGFRLAIWLAWFLGSNTAKYSWRGVEFLYRKVRGAPKPTLSVVRTEIPEEALRRTSS